MTKRARTARPFARIGNDALLSIVQFLKWYEVSRARCICKSFNKVAQLPTAFSTLDFRYRTEQFDLMARRNRGDRIRDDHLQRFAYFTPSCLYLSRSFGYDPKIIRSMCTRLHHLDITMEMLLKLIGSMSSFTLRCMRSIRVGSADQYLNDESDRRKCVDWLLKQPNLTECHWMKGWDDAVAFRYWLRSSYWPEFCKLPVVEFCIGCEASKEDFASMSKMCNVRSLSIGMHGAGGHEFTEISGDKMDGMLSCVQESWPRLSCLYVRASSPPFMSKPALAVVKKMRECNLRECFLRCGDWSFPFLFPSRAQNIENEVGAV